MILPVPYIICLCGSTRFYQEFQEWNYKFTMQGKIVLSVGVYPHVTKEIHAGNMSINGKTKEDLDELHKRKIDISDGVFIINPGGYVGESTKSEIEYAIKQKKDITFLESFEKVMPHP